MSRGLRVALALVLAAGLAVAAVAYLNLRGEAPLRDGQMSSVPTPQQIERGRALAVLGNCAACHTARGGAAFAGGRPIDTPFGVVYGSNLTPDPEHGLGRWNDDHFWRAMHHGRSRDGRLLSPAFPYPNFTRITRADSDALFAYLRSLPAVAQPNRAADVQFPFDTQAALAVWRALFFRAGEFRPDAQRDAAFNRGAYLVQGLAHCTACHGERNLFGATSESLAFSGGLLPMTGWYAPSLARSDEAGVVDWPRDEVVALLKTGSAPRGSVLGPMAEVVFRSTQHVHDDDLRAIATFLQSLPPSAPPRTRMRRVEPAEMRRGAQVYEARCADCHGKAGEGAAAGPHPRAVPPLAGNRALTMHEPANLIRVVISGGYAPATAGNPRPFGMPPLGQDLTDIEIAAVVTFIRNSWGHQAGAVRPHEVARLR
ncbi:MAG: cytochrome c [Burkholderiaceae bacterium]|jgi:mono/diheme cytochrome c family protein|nr:cytochrome c [Burkholderiaceae bacterium]